MSRAHVILVGSLVIASACQEAAPDFGDPRPRLPAPAGTGMATSPANPPDAPYSCVRPPAEARDFREVAGLLPADIRGTPRPHEEGWEPDLLVDVVPGEDLLVADALAPAVHRISTDLARRELLLREGHGPNEVVRPIAIARGPGEGFVVLDDGSGAVKAFAPDGRERWTRPVPAAASDLAVTMDGSILLAHVVWAVPQRSGQDAVVVSMLRPGDEEFTPFITLAAGDMDGGRIAVPGPVQTRVTASTEVVMVWYPAGGTVDVYGTDGRRRNSFRVCVPDHIDAFYARQRREAQGSAVAITLLGDVLALPDGGFATVGPSPDAAGRYHVAFFSPEGEPGRTMVSGTTGARLLSEVRFGETPDDLWTFDYSGAIARVRLTDAP